MRRTAFISLFLLLLGGNALQGRQLDTVMHERIDSTVFSSERNVSVMSGSLVNELKVKLENLQTVPSPLGTADPIRFVRLLPGVQNGSELDAGIHVQGTESAHCLVSVEGVPVYGVTHLLGIFSTFIPTHYREMSYTPQPSRSNRLGGSVDMKLPDAVPRRFRGSVTTGLLETEGTLDIPLGKRSGLFLSARKSYVNLLYGYFISIRNITDIRYGFGDGNLTWYWTPGPEDRVWVDVYGAYDKVDFASMRSGFVLDLTWANLMGAAHYLHSWDGGSLKQSLYATGIGMQFDFVHSFYTFQVPSSLGTVGYKALLKTGRLQAGLDAAWHRCLPQSVDISNRFFFHPGEVSPQAALEVSADVHYLLPVTPWFDVEASLKGVFWRSHDGAAYPALLPELRASWNLGGGGRIETVAGYTRQHLFQTGSTGLGLPVEYWFLSGKDFGPQSSRYAALSYGLDFLGGRYTFSASAFYRGLDGQVDFGGTLLDYLDESFTPSSPLVAGRGRNYGVSAMLHRKSGALTGWVSYTWSRSLRTFGGVTFPSNHERIHELNAVAGWSAGKWDFGAVLVAASGLPFTAAESFYLIGGDLVMNFSPRNGRRMDPYFRADLTASYYFHREDGRENGLTASVYNIAGYKNPLYYSLTETDDGFAYRPSALNFRFVPSLTYFHKF